MAAPQKRLRTLLILLGVLVLIGAALSPQLIKMLAEARRIEQDQNGSHDQDRPQPQPALTTSPGELQQAKADVEVHPRDYSARLKYAAQLGQNRRYDEAIAQLKTAAVMRPKNAEPHLALGQIYEGQQLFDFAMEERRAAVRLEPENPSAVAALGYMYVAFGWHLAARELLEPVVARHGEDALLHHCLGMTLYQMMDYHGALREITAAKKIDPSNKALDGPLIDIYMRLNDPRSAAAAAERALTSDPQNAAYHVGRAKALHALNELAGAEAEVRQVLQHEPDNLEARYELALILKQKSDDAGAQKELEQVIGANPLYESATALLAQLYHRQGRKADAQMLLKTFEEKHAAADPSVKWSLKVGNEPSNAMAHFELGKIHYKRGKLARALVELKETLRLQPMNAEASSLLARALRERDSSRATSAGP